MTIKLELKCYSATVSFQGGDTGLQLAAGGWQPRVATPGEDGPITEQFTVHAQAASQNALATLVQGLHDMQTWAARYQQNPQDFYPVWLHVKLNNETGERRALVRRITVAYGTSWFDGASATNYAQLNISIEREPYWEAVAATTLPAANGITGPANKYVMDSLAIPGDVPARIERLCVGYSANVSRVWMGLRSAAGSNFLQSTNFVPVWEFERGVTIPGYSVLATDVNASPGGAGNTRITATLSDYYAWHRVATLRLSDITANSMDQWGKHLFLLRAHSGNGGIHYVKLAFGYTGMTDSWLWGPLLTVASGASEYNLYEAGIAQIGTATRRVWPTSSFALGYDSTFAINVYAYRTADNQPLALDCLCVIPLDEGFCKIWGNGLPDGTAFMAYGEAPSGEQTAMRILNSTFAGTQAFAAQDFRIPASASASQKCIVAAWAQQDRSVLTDTLAFNSDRTGTLWPRWASLRGNE